MPLVQAETLIFYGRFLCRTGRPREARAALHQATDILTATEGGRLLVAARRELTGAGGRRARAGAKDQLTDKERQVAELAARHFTDAQIAAALFISQRTVGHHLSSAFRKLGITSRHELAPLEHEEARP